MRWLKLRFSGPQAALPLFLYPPQLHVQPTFLHQKKCPIALSYHCTLFFCFLFEEKRCKIDLLKTSALLLPLPSARPRFSPFQGGISPSKLPLLDKETRYVISESFFMIFDRSKTENLVQQECQHPSALPPGLASQDHAVSVQKQFLSIIPHRYIVISLFYS